MLDVEHAGLAEERRLERSDDPLIALTRLLESARRSAEIEAVAVADQTGILVAGSGAAELCDELAAIAPLGSEPANDTVPSRLDVLSRGARVRRLSVDGVEVFVSGRGGNLGEGLAQIAEGCSRILGRARSAR
ncbi:MAG TPA: hypothetical protein VGI10_19005 [Polyangiaceae bacterium]|jgi:hypothetical protein